MTICSSLSIPGWPIAPIGTTSIGGPTFTTNFPMSSQSTGSCRKKCVYGGRHTESSLRSDNGKPPRSSWPELQRGDFPVRVVQQYGWGHSLALGGDLRQARSATPEGSAFIVHACEGVDEQAREELFGLDRLGLWMRAPCSCTDWQSMMQVSRSCASAGFRSSSAHLRTTSFRKAPRHVSPWHDRYVALGNDSPLTAEGDLLDEIRFAIRFCGIPPHVAYRMVTEAPAAVLRLKDAEGSIKISGSGI